MGKSRTKRDIQPFTILSAEELRKLLNISQTSLSRLTKEGVIRRLGHGLYTHAKRDIPAEDLDFAVACARFGSKSAIAGLSALFHYGLIEQPPMQIWVLAPPDKSDHNRLYRPLRTKNSYVHGIDKRDFYRITNIERTLIEALRFSSKIGPRVAINAARKALQQKMTTESKLGEMAKKMKLRSVLEKYWEAIVT